MSLNKFTSSQNENKFFNPRFETLQINNGLNMSNSGINNVSSINGMPIPPIGFDLNPVNIIFQPGSVPSAGSNIVSTWAEVLLKASRVNVNQCINIFFDDTHLPCTIDQSYDFQGRGIFLGINNNFIAISVEISDGVTISNIKEMQGVQLLCDCITTPSISFSTLYNPVLYLKNYAYLNNNSSSAVSAIQIIGSVVSIYLENSCFFRSGVSPLVPLINLSSGSTLNILNNFNSINPSLLNDSISDDGSCIINLYTDSSWSSYPTFSGFTGTYNKINVDNSQTVKYNDSLALPAWSTSNVQSSFDYIKGNYIQSGSTSPFVTGAISCTSLTSSGTISCGTNAMTCGSLSSRAINSGTFGITSGSISCTSLLSTGTISCGTNAMTSGAHTCTSLTSTGTMSCGTNAMTCGALTSGAITSTGTFTNGTNAMTSGAHTCTSLTSTGTISCGTNAMTCGALSCSSITDSGTLSCTNITSTGTFTNGTNAMTSGAHTCTSLTSTGTISCGTNSMTCGALSCSSITDTGTLSCTNITSTGTFTNGTNAMTTGALSSRAINAGTFSITSGSISCSSISASGTVRTANGAFGGPSHSFVSNTQSGMYISGSPTDINLQTDLGLVFTGGGGLVTLWGNTQVNGGTLEVDGNGIFNSNLTVSGDINIGGSISAPYPNIYVNLSVTQSIPNNTDTAITFDTITFTDGNITFVAPGTTMTITKAGFYELTYGCSFASNAVGSRYLWALINGATIVIKNTFIANTLNPTRISNTFQYLFSIGDTITFNVNQNSGGALNIGGDTDCQTWAFVNFLHL